MSNRLLYNRSIIEKLSELVEKNPYLRFNQLLINCGVLETTEILCQGDRETVIKDSFYEEPEITWKRMCDNKFCFSND